MPPKRSYASPIHWAAPSSGPPISAGRAGRQVRTPMAPISSGRASHPPSGVRTRVTPARTAASHQRALGSSGARRNQPTAATAPMATQRLGITAGPLIWVIHSPEKSSAARATWGGGSSRAQTRKAP
ncbi:hypothetical protein [Streptomyces malaysiensis]|uniref:hypothetical protein n=1 Tax=Streptomyces malaysiensis TaxID=92644 RepID=UPI00163DDA9D|nr:hypothetical protein [Streptomyces malaysiensis]